jgi:adhesin transport system outer membrane protein
MKKNPQFRNLRWAVLMALPAVLGTQPVAAQDLRSYAQRAITSNPEVTARFNALRAAIDEIDVARGAFYPRIDVLANTGRERSESSFAATGVQSFSRQRVGLELNQILWDGLATYNEVRRLGHGSVVRFFEFLEASELMALESARAYYDVQRFRELVAIAENNYVQHKQTYDQIEQRFKSGVGRGVDLEQAAARLALADSNLVNETSNLHDVSARFQRINGEPPPQNLPPTTFPRPGFPQTRDEALRLAVARQPGINAATENVRAVQAQLDVRRAAFQPKLEARLRDANGRNIDGSIGRNASTVAELVLSWNIFSGGSDMARLRQFANAVNNARDLRDKACRDVRQTLSIAYNDANKLTDQIRYLRLQVEATEKARDAYRKQFDIGQRSLLDLLNSENELYQARRALINAQYDLEVAYARVHNATGGLLAQLGLARMDTGSIPGVEGWAAGEDAAERCPPDTVTPPPIDRSALDARAQAVAATFARPAPVVPPETAVPKSEDAVTARLLAWATAWSSKSAERYFEFYADSFAPKSMSREAWRAQRAKRLATRDAIAVTLADIQVTMLAPDRAESRFQQRYESGTFSDQTEKTIVWQLIGGRWMIVSESGR